MTAFRFIHSSDLHLGKRFGNIAEELRGRLREARHGALGRLAMQARTNGATTILLAGDTFDTETPAADVRRQALSEMGHHGSLRWVILPGNHDSLQASQLWNSLRSDAPENVALAIEPVAMPIAPGVMLLPAPCTTRRPGRDLTGWMDEAATPSGTIRIGLAHGAIRDFSEDGTVADVVPPDRARRSGIDYLALGDWHGAMKVDARTYYSGTPEPDRFKHDRPGQALVVCIDAAGAVPEVTPVETGSFAWRTVRIDLLSQDDATRRLEELLPAGPARRQTLMRVAAFGRASLSARIMLMDAIARATPEFAYLELDDAALATNCESEDLDLIDRAGALREAAEALRAESLDPARSLAERDVARAALMRLFSYAQHVAS
ncbi:metallophosphoesterase family protein [Ancylobacter pratisalsi]|uniref:DNA repair exonuclease n=1 Tax=Ancylobacter pratisalsi TaxID=1745854 RepID=A0A6P1YKB1_9HYPH|nr:DNA repair exonuclease [Ancylobacter pratisalsi]QIB33602.1 DNA repair exonuclease [Ancylobacter pratisalsi]